MSLILLTTLGLLVAVMLALWLLSLHTLDVSVVDIFWGLGFAGVAWVSHAASSNESLRAWLVCLLVTIWGVRLAAHLAMRNLGRGEDYRYRAMRERHGDRFALASLGTVFLLQAVLLWIVSWPVQAVHHPSALMPLGWLDVTGVALWAVGLGMEAIADAQLARFKRSPASTGAVMDRGLWRYSRHPNYFGDCLVWWGLGLIALGAGQWWALVGPAVMTVLLVKVSGVAMLESTIADRRPAYRAYIARTSAFVPWPPRSTR